MVHIEKEVYENDECMICSDTFKDLDNIVLLPCDHKFHICCLYKWLKTGADSCPCCRDKDTLGKIVSTFENILKKHMIKGATSGSIRLDDIVRKWVSDSMEKYLKCKTIEERIVCENDIYKHRLFSN
jgi:hypothetical protein